MNTPQRIQSLHNFITGLVLYSMLAWSPAQAETIDCTAITSLPYTITTQGVYCLTDNLSTSMTSGNAIEIQTNNVTIDLNGFKLNWHPAAVVFTSATGIYASQRKNITIHNGIIRGFRRGIWFHDTFPYTTSQGHRVSDILAEQNTYVGIMVQGRSITIRSNRVLETTTDSGSVITILDGIYVAGPNNFVLDNQVIRTGGLDPYNDNFVTGIKLMSADNSMVINNWISVVYAYIGMSWAINISGDNILVKDNTISSAEYGIHCFSCLYGGNYLSNVLIPFVGGTAAGTTNYTNP